MRDSVSLRGVEAFRDRDRVAEAFDRDILVEASCEGVQQVVFDLGEDLVARSAINGEQRLELS